MCTAAATKKRSTAQLMGTGNKRGFTLIEILIVVSIIGLLATMAVPIYSKVITRTKETLVRHNLSTIRQMLDEYTCDKQKAPQTLQDLVTEGYLREVHLDLVTGSRNTWQIKIEDVAASVNPASRAFTMCAAAATERRSTA